MGAPRGGLTCHQRGRGEAGVRVYIRRAPGVWHSRSLWALTWDELLATEEKVKEEIARRKEQLWAAARLALREEAESESP